MRTHIRGACWNVANRSQFASREPFLTRLDRGLFRRATAGELATWRTKQRSGATRPSKARVTGDAVRGSEWHTEEHVQQLLVEWLVAHGWTIVRTANTAMREPGVDVVAERDGTRLGVEVNGYPSLYYVAGPKKGLEKPTPPKQQAKKWFAHALVPAMQLRTSEPASLSVMCFPDFPVYRSLFEATTSSLQAAGIQVWLVSDGGQVERLD